MAKILTPELQQKWDDLVDHLRQIGPMVVAFSGGVDSGLLSVAAYEALGDEMLALTIHSPVDPPGEMEAAAALVSQVGFPHRFVEMDDLGNANFVSNPPDRCYYCKKVRLKALQDLGASLGFPLAAEGSNADDENDYRPGKRAVIELNVRSPLAEVGFTKAEIRAVAMQKDLVVWDRPSAPCLATRFPYGTSITASDLGKVYEAEKFLSELGFEPVRVRYGGNEARIEVAPAEISRVIGLRENIARQLKEIGFRYITLDLEGYRSGSMNEVLK